MTRISIALLFCLSCSAQQMHTDADQVFLSNFIPKANGSSSGPSGWTLYYLADNATNSMGALVSRQPDSVTTNGYHLQATGTARPYATNSATAINSHWWLHYNGTANQMITNFSVTFGQTNTWFAVCKFTTLSGIEQFIDGGAAQDARNVVYWNGAMDMYAGSTGIGPTTVPTGWVIYAWQFSSTTSQAWTNGVSWYSGLSVGTQGQHGVSIGAGGSASFFAVWDEAFVGMVNGPMDSTKVAAKFTELNGIFGIY